MSDSTPTRRILTIDGGGLRGVFAAAVIEQMEKANKNRPATSPSGRAGPDLAALRRRAEAWRPWRAYATLLLWNSLAGSGG